MEYTTLGRTGLKVSRMGLGCGGHSRLGLALGRSQSDAEAVVRAALEIGVNFIDTAESYGTEEAVGNAIKDTSRTDIIISTKAGVDWQGKRCSPVVFRERIGACLARLGTDYIDLFNLHGVSLEEYPYAVSELLPVIVKMQESGRIRFIGITEQFINDPGHSMLSPAVLDGYWDVVMVGFNILNQSARARVLAQTQEHNVGTQCMFAVRRALSRPDALIELMTSLAQQGLINANDFDAKDPLGFLTADGGAESIPDAAYRFCRHEPGMDIILSGTSSIEHLKSNASSIERPPLPESMCARLRSLFGRVDCVSGN